jgi:hypothetical protein
MYFPATYAHLFFLTWSAKALAFLSEEEGETLVDKDLRDDHVKGVRPQEGGRQPYGT